MNIYSYIPEMVVMACGVYVDNKYVYVLSVYGKGRQGDTFGSAFLDGTTGFKLQASKQTFLTTDIQMIVL